VSYWDVANLICIVVPFLGLYLYHEQLRKAQREQ
jgi:hypothetical protein